MSYKLFVTAIPSHFEKQDVLDCFFNDSRLCIEQLIKAKGSYNKKKAVISTDDEALFDFWSNQRQIVIPSGETLLVEVYLQGKSLEKRVNDQVKRRVSLFKIKGEISESRLRHALSIFGPVESCYTIKYRDKKDKYYGFATFQDLESASKALSQGKCILSGHEIVIKPYTVKNTEVSKPF